MDFPESVKIEAKQRAHYQCVICRRSVFLHVHHITPQEENGPATLDNAAPLCVECHDLFGGDPGKRKWIREVRDFWWKYCDARPAAPEVTATLQRLDKLQTEIASLREDQTRYGEVLGEIKTFVTGQLHLAALQVRSAHTMKEVAAASSTSFSPEVVREIGRALGAVPGIRPRGQ